MCVLMPLILPNAEPARPVARRSGTLLGGGVSEWPKEHASKACEGLRPPRVQIPPPPPLNSQNARIAVWGSGRPSCSPCGPPKEAVQHPSLSRSLGHGEILDSASEWQIG